jgi:hypothetical protein
MDGIEFVCAQLHAMAAPPPPRTVSEIERSEHARERAAYSRARRLVMRSGGRIRIENEKGIGYWVWCRELDDTPADPLADDHYVIDGHELLDAVQRLRAVLGLQQRTQAEAQE